MKYLASWQGVVDSATSDCFDLVGRCCRVMLSRRSTIQLAGDLRSRFQTPAPESTTCGKNMIGWKIDFFL